MLAGCFFFLNGCKKNDGDSSNHANHDIHGSWKNTYFMRNYTAPVTNQVDVYGSLSACRKDDILILRADNTFEFNEGATKCDPGHPQVIETGTYQLLNSNTKISYSNGWAADITELTSSSLKLKYTYTGTGSQYYDVIYYTKQ